MKKILIFTVLVLAILISSLNKSFATDVSNYMFRPQPVSISECEKIKDQYGISVCTVDNDYWVGAVVACGGVNNLPSSNDFYRIKEKIVNDMIEYYDPSYFNEYYSNINQMLFYSDEPYQKKAVDENANWLVKKWQNWRYNVNYNKVHGYKLSINSSYASINGLLALDKAYDRYVQEETRRVEEWNKENPDNQERLNLSSRYDFMKSKIGGYSSSALYRDNYDLKAYAICKCDLLR